MFLVDTNIFLEILLGQDKEEECRSFLHLDLQIVTMDADFKKVQDLVKVIFL